MYSDQLVDTRYLRVDTFTLFNLMCWDAKRVVATLAIVRSCWCRQKPPPDSIEGWSHKQIRERFGYNPDPRVFQALYADIVHDARRFLCERAPLCNGAHDVIYAKSNGICYHCGGALNPETFHIDHLVSIVDGGLSHPDNLVGSCPFCNLSKGPYDAPKGAER